MFLITVALCSLAVWGITKAAQTAMRRFGLDAMTVLLWLGLAEWPGEATVRRRPARPDGWRAAAP
jgi:hypothetical protein